MRSESFHVKGQASSGKRRGTTTLQVTEALSSVEHSKNMRDKFARQQIFMTLGGAGLIVLSFLVFSATSVWTFMSTEETLTSGGVDIRRRLAQSVNDKVATALTSVYETSRRLAEEADVGQALGSEVWPPTPRTFETRMSELVSRVNVPLEADLKIRATIAQRKNSSLIAYVGLVWGFFAYQADMKTPATNFQECAHVYHVGATALQVNPDRSFTYTDAPMRPAIVTKTSEDENGTKSTEAEWRLFDSRSKMVFPFPLFSYGLSCTTMLGMWARQQARDSSFGNSWWYTPGGNDPYNSIYGNAPIATPEGKEWGYVGTAISMTDSISPVLQALLEDGGEFTKGAQLAMVTESGRLRGASEFDDISAMFNVKEDVPRNSSLSQAIETLEEETGSVCPETHVVTGTGGKLIDSLPFHAEEYGMPPLEERWCVIISIPRENVYEAFDNATEVRVITGIINILVFVCAIVLLIVSLFIALKSDRKLRKEKMKADLKHVITAIREVQSLNCPMVLVSSKEFLEFKLLESYESLRDRGAHLVLDCIEDIRSFKKNNMILFFSHQWLSVAHPDENGIQLAAMKGAIQRVLADKAAAQDVYIWCDYTSIAQQQKKMQQAAILSLPVYARMADKFIVVAPPAIHSAHHGMCDLETYNKRGWCRAEMLAKACGSGIEEMYTCCDKSGTLDPITTEDLTRMSFKIFEGQFSVEEDVEILVTPVLGLYSLVLHDVHLPHMQVIHAHIGKDKERFFPRSYLNNKTGERVELFGKCISLMEVSVKNKPQLWDSPIASPVRSVSKTTSGTFSRTMSYGSPSKLPSFSAKTTRTTATPPVTPSEP